MLFCFFCIITSAPRINYCTLKNKHDNRNFPCLFPKHNPLNGGVHGQAPLELCQWDPSSMQEKLITKPSDLSHFLIEIIWNCIMYCVLESWSWSFILGTRLLYYPIVALYTIDPIEPNHIAVHPPNRLSCHVTFLHVTCTQGRLLPYLAAALQYRLRVTTLRSEGGSGGLRCPAKESSIHR